uniref:Uncharacterized protein n=1 Tax=Anguilla anguilla TaxID=7936 RepID=A0A0E9WPG6_ANGAN
MLGSMSIFLPARKQAGYLLCKKACNYTAKNYIGVSG